MSISNDPATIYRKYILSKSENTFTNTLKITAAVQTMSEQVTILVIQLPHFAEKTVAVIAHANGAQINVSHA